MGYVHCNISKTITFKALEGRRHEFASLSRLLAAQTLCEEAPVVSPSVETGVQSFDYTALAACVRELKEKWTPAKVDQVGLMSIFLSVMESSVCINNAKLCGIP